MDTLGTTWLHQTFDKAYNMDILTTAAQSYMTIFSGYVNQFLSWGQWLFFSLLVMNIVWMTLWNAFDRHAISQSMPAFIKQFFGIAFFYTIMMNPGWLSQVLKTVQFMGSSLTHSPIDPSSIISEGMGIANKVIIPIEKSSLLTMGFGLMLIFIVYIVIMFVFISIALELALTLIITTALIAIATFFLGFSGFAGTTQIARQTLDVILANCVKLLGIYIVVAAGSQTIVAISSSIPTEIVSFEPYGWIVSVTLLFWLLAKNLPNQLAKIVSGAIQESRGTDVAALAMTGSQIARTTLPVIVAGSGMAQGFAKMAGSIAYNAASHFNEGMSKAGIGAAVSASVGGAAVDLAKGSFGKVSDHFRDVSNKMAGGTGLGQPISSVSERMYKTAKDRNSQI